MNIRLDSLALIVLPCLLVPAARAQQKQPSSSAPVVAPAPPDAPDATAYAKEGVVFTKISTVIAYQADGTGEKTMEVTLRVQSENGVHQAGLLDFVYAAGTEHLAIDYARVRKPDGTVIDTPPDGAQDMPTEVTRQAPFYSDLREVQLPVKSLSVGDTLEYRIRYEEQKPLAPGEFWGAASFTTSNVALDDRIELSFPSDKYVLVLSPKNKPTITEENGRDVYRWKTANLKPPDEKKQAADAGELPAITWTTFHNWQEIGEWFGNLAKDRAAVTPEIQAKADELTKGKTTDDEKIEAIYEYVSTQVRYIGVAFGIGRYQPHSADAVLENQYGDCKDKSTLLSALLKAAGYNASPALIGTTTKLHPEMPSPSQFDHVITFVSLPNRTIWLDSTPEITPYRMLIAPIRDKEALVIPSTGSPELMRTPAAGPFPFVDTYTATAKLDDDGTLTGHLSFEMRGDTEVVFREIFHSLPRSQWQQTAESMSERMGFAGTVSNLDVSLPERAEKPFEYSYDYNRKDYADWSNRRILPLTLPVSLNDLGDDSPTTPIELGSPRVEVHHSEIELPSDYTAVLPHSVSYSTAFAKYEADYKLDGKKFVTDRRLEILKDELPDSEEKAYRQFTKNVDDDQQQYVQLVSANAAVKPDTTPSNPEAREFMQTAAANLTNHDLADARTNLEQAAQLNPKEEGLWGEYAYLEMMSNQLDAAIEDLRKEVGYHPQNTMAWEQMVQMQIRLKRMDDAVQSLQDMLKAVPGNTPGELQLGSLLVLQKKYGDAADELEGAAKLAPKNTDLQIQAGRAELLAGKRDTGEAMLRKALDGATDPNVLNNAAYELADSGLDLTLAESSSKKAIDDLDKQTSQISLGNLSTDDLAHVQLLTAAWDTMGWIYFQEGKLPLAESYVLAAWNTTQAAEVGGHLGQIYEKEGKLKEAAEVDAMAVSAATLSPDPSGTDEISGRLAKLQRRSIAAPKDPGAELGTLRTISLPRVMQGEASADFFVLLAPGKVADATFIKGDERLRTAAEVLEKATFPAEFPAGSNGQLVRRGILFCSSATKDCHFTLLLPQSVTLH